MTSIFTPTGDEATASSPTDSIEAVDVDTVNGWLDQLKLIGVELRDSNGEPVAVTDDNAAEIAEAVKAIAAQQATMSDDSEDADDENLAPFELPEMYRDNSNRESLSESSAYAEHLNEHWGF